ncbi:hypothetical protein E2C01_008798 [Portunus trituberculatus]|uniref:Uncharacterized protein n=1 Tax=Portunus trituberculatus TaxID=210409 RepID=A0A5B7D1R4_PORTR|nr:hypothetical protein [Portunus trituberculatus]
MQVLNNVSHLGKLSGVWFGLCAAHLQCAHDYHAHHKSCQELAAHGECEEQLVLTWRLSGTQWPFPACVALIYSRRTSPKPPSCAFYSFSSSSISS